MTKADLILHLAERNPQFSKRAVERMVDTIFDEITAALARGDRVELRGFGTFSVKKRDARTGRNPRTREIITVEARANAYFKTGRALRKGLNE
jgi:integration host factor subunit beta